MDIVIDNHVSYLDQGRLGNLMSQYGSVYGVARHLDVPATITQLHKTRLKQLFPNISIPMYARSNCTNQNEWLVSYEFVDKKRFKTNNIILADWYKQQVVTSLSMF